MKKVFFVSLLFMAVSGLFCEMSIKDVLNRFNKKLAQNSIPKAKVVIALFILVKRKSLEL